MTMFNPLRKQKTMGKRIILGLLLAVFAMCVKAQVYDGITQPTKWRIWVPVTANLHGHGKTSVAPFVAYKQDLGEHFSVTGVAQYNIGNESFIPQIWLNANIGKKFYVLSRSIYDTKANLYKHTMSATYKLPLGFMVDGTWENLYNGKKFCDGDRLQFLGGYAFKCFVVNAGYSCRTDKGFVANVRWKVTPKDWLQLKYDAGNKSIQVSTALQFD